MEKPLHEMSAAIAGIALEGESGSNGIMKHNPPQMPNEMWEKVFLSVEQSDIKNLRLAWRRWDKLGFRLLFRPFVFRPDRNDLDKFDRVIEHSAVISGLRFELGTIDILAMVESLSSEYTQAYNVLQELDRHTASDYSAQTLEETKLDAIRQYSSWIVDVRTSTNPTVQGRMDAAISKLDNLERIDMVYRNPPFNNKLLLAAWVQRNGGNEFRRTSREFWAIMRSLRTSKSRLKHLTHDNLPVGTFVRAPGFDFDFSPTIFASLQTLHLTFDATTTPHTKFWENLGEFLRTAPRLKDLRFGFDSIDVGYVISSRWEECHHPVRWYLPLWKFLGEHQWPELKSIRLDGLMVCEKGLSEFLSRHNKTLRSLELCRIALWQGSFQGLLTSLRSSLQLENFRIWGTIRAFHRPYEAWRLPQTLDDFPTSWSPEFISFMRKSTKKTQDSYTESQFMSPMQVRDRLESFMASTVEWPLMESDILISVVHPRFRPAVQSIHGPNCCAMSMADINKFWEDGLRGSLNAWADLNFSFRSDPLPGLIKREMVETYREDGFDDEGFDRHGYDAGGTHHLDTTYEWPGALNTIHPATALREILASVLDHISEKAEVIQEIGEGDDGSWSRWISIGPKRV